MTAHPLRHVDDYLAVGQEAGASDVHLAVNAPPTWRLHGTLQPIWPDAPPLSAEQTERLAESFLSKEQSALVRERGDADFAFEMAEPADERAGPRLSGAGIAVRRSCHVGQLGELRGRGG